MKVTEHLENANGKALFSFEILPPLKGQSIQSTFQHIDTLMEFDPPFIDVTYHREEYIYKEKPNGLLQKKVVRKRPGTVGICAAIQNRYRIDAIPHILCGGFTKEETENFLIDLDFLEIDNVLALRGDAVKNETYFSPHKEGNSYAKDLVEQIVDLNKGQYLEEDLKNNCCTDFCVGVAGYPEKHMEAPSLHQDVQYLKEKVKAGASYIVTQMFFDNQKYFDFVSKCREEGIDIPIIPGLKPLASLRQLSVLPHRFHVDLPDELTQEILKCTSKEAIQQVGIEWCIQQSKELVEFGAPVLHYYSMGKADKIHKVASEVF